MAFDVEAAKADGYTDEEIQHYLNTKELPVEKPISRSEEAIGTMQASLPQGAIYAGEGAAIGYGGKLLKDVLTNRAAPTPSIPAPSAGPVAPNPAVSPSYAAPSPVAQQANLFQKGMETAAKMREMAAQFATQNASKMLKGGIGASAALYSPSLNPNEDEELRRRRQMGFQGQ